MTDIQLKKLLKKLDEVSGTVAAYETSGQIEDLTKEVSEIKETLADILRVLKDRE